MAIYGASAVPEAIYLGAEVPQFRTARIEQIRREKRTLKEDKKTAFFGFTFKVLLFSLAKEKEETERQR